MKTITANEDNRSYYIFEDTDVIEAGESEITTPLFTISDFNSNNATILQGVTPPSDWMGGKYFFDGSNWVEDSEWVHPVQDEINGLQAQIAMLQASLGE